MTLDAIEGCTKHHGERRGLVGRAFTALLITLLALPLLAAAQQTTAPGPGPDSPSRLASPSLPVHATPYNLQDPVTPIAREMYALHNYIVWICVAIFIGVFGVMGYALVKHRKSVGHQAAHFHENTLVEVVWTVIPFLILLFMAWPATKTILQMKDTSNPDLTIKVTGYQWKWNYDYIHDGFSFYSNLTTPLAQRENREPKGANYLLEVDNPMVVPVNAKVRLVITANDVIHAWWIPAFGVKQDAIPGFVRDTWFKAEKVGVYRGQCAELCGKEHGYMPIVVEVKSPDDYKAWATQQKAKNAVATEDPNKTWDPKELAGMGEKIYQSNCAACHQGQGQGVPGAFPALAGSKVVNGAPADQIHIVLNGKPGTAMPSWKQLSDTDIAAVIDYTRTSWGNKGEPVQPKDVKAGRSS